MKRRSRQGFTMGEMIVAMAITAFVATAAVGGIALLLTMRKSLEVTNAAQTLEQAAVYTISEGLNGCNGSSKNDSANIIYYCDDATGEYFTYKNGTDGIVRSAYGTTSTEELFENYYANLGLKTHIEGLNNGLDSQTFMFTFTVSILDKDNNEIVSNVITVHPDHLTNNQ